MAAVVNAPRPVSWSNRLGVSLTPITTGVWAAERPFFWNKIDVGGRSVVCRVGDGSLFVHSPVEHTADLGRCLDALGGGVGYVMSPNYEHVKYAKQWSDVYPDAKMVACPGLPARMPEVPWSIEIGSGSTASSFSAEVRRTIEYVHFDCEESPLPGGGPFFNEVVWFHVPSRTLFMSDAYWNYPSSERANYAGDVEGTGTVHECPKMPVDPSRKGPGGTLPAVRVPKGTRLWKLGMDKVYLPFYKRVMVGRRGERRDRYNAAVAQLLAWEPEVIVPCHGDVVRGQRLCQKVLAKHFE
jgi:hypothetical protein